MKKWGIFVCDCCKILDGRGVIILNNNKGIAICDWCIEELYKDIFKPKEEILIIRKTITENLRETILKKNNYQCVQCKSKENLQIDHIKPFSKGGRTNRRNLQVLCKTCNSKKRCSLETKAGLFRN